MYIHHFPVLLASTASDFSLRLTTEIASHTLALSTAHIYSTIRPFIMSFIHCSPLFHPLEPVPIMSPTVMRSAQKAHDNAVVKGTSVGTATAKKGKKPAPSIARHPSQPLADTRQIGSALAGPSHARQGQSATSSDARHMTFQEPNSQSAYQQNLFDSQDQGSITFTAESQPMYDLSSSQQMNDSGR